jgi:hypothetical protein
MAALFNYRKQQKPVLLTAWQTRQNTQVLTRKDLTSLAKEKVLMVAKTLTTRQSQVTLVVIKEKIPTTKLTDVLLSRKQKMSFLICSTKTRLAHLVARFTSFTLDRFFQFASCWNVFSYVVNAIVGMNVSLNKNWYSQLTLSREW